MGETPDPMTGAEGERESTSGAGRRDTADDALAFDVVEIVAVGDDDDDATGDRPTASPETTDAIRHDIEHTRAQMSDTIDEIQERLNPKRLIDEAKETVRDATVGKVTGMMNNASRSAGSLVDRIKENPVSAAMIGAGAWWLLTKLPDHGRSSSYARNYGNFSSEVGQSSYRGDSGWSGRTGESGGIGDMARSATETVGGYTSRGREQVSQMANETERAFNRWIRENPLAVGAAAVAVGAVIGAAIPETQRERELVGDARDRLVGAAKDLATQKVEQVTSAMPGGNSDNSSSASSSGGGSSSPSGGSGNATPGNS
jgi:Protein of unknown function (DUF3618)